MAVSAGRRSRTGRGERSRSELLQLRAALSGVGHRRRLRLRASREDRRAAEPGTHGALRARSPADRHLAQLAARDNRRPLPARRPPAPERDDRRLGAAAARAGPDPGDARRRRRTGRGDAGVPDAPARGTAPLAGRLVWGAPAGLLRLRAAPPAAPEHRARGLDLRRARVLVAGVLERAEPALDRGAPRVPRRGVRRLGLPLARAHLLGARLLRLLRGGASPLGAVPAEGPEPGRDPDERRADGGLLRRHVLLPPPAPLGGGGITAGSRGPVRRATILAALGVALLIVPAAQANGDPASDVLITQQVFIPFEAPISKSASEELTKTVAGANKRGYKIRVAVIAFTGDLGTAISLWGHPQAYAKFLGSELAFAYSDRLLVAMPAGFGFHRGTKPVAQEQRVLAELRTGKTPTALTESATEAVRSLAAEHGIVLPTFSSGSTVWRDRVIIGAVVLLALLVIFVPARKVRGRGGER